MYSKYFECSFYSFQFLLSLIHYFVVIGISIVDLQYHLHHSFLYFHYVSQKQSNFFKFRGIKIDMSYMNLFLSPLFKMMISFWEIANSRISTMFFCSLEHSGLCSKVKEDYRSYSRWSLVKRNPQNFRNSNTLRSCTLIISLCWKFHVITNVHYP